MSLRRKMQPAGRTLQQNESLPIKESKACLVQLQRYLRWSTSESKACFCSCVILASIVAVFSRMPRNVNTVDGPSTLDDFTGALILLQKESIAVRLFKQSLVSAGSAVKKSSK